MYSEVPEHLFRIYFFYICRASNILPCIEFYLYHKQITTFRKEHEFGSSVISVYMQITNQWKCGLALWYLLSMTVYNKTVKNKWFFDPEAQVCIFPAFKCF